MTVDGAALLGELDDGLVAVVLGGADDDDVLCLELLQQLGEAARAHVQEEAKLLLGGLGLDLEHGDQALVDAELLAVALVHGGLGLLVAAQKTAHAADLVLEGHLLEGSVLALGLALDLALGCGSLVGVLLGLCLVCCVILVGNVLALDELLVLNGVLVLDLRVSVDLVELFVLVL